METLEFVSAVRGYHIYKDIWEPSVAISHALLFRLTRTVVLKNKAQHEKLPQAFLDLLREMLSQ